MRRAFLVSLLLILATVAAYWPIRHAEFLNFDDNQYVTSNPRVFHGLTRTDCAWAFTTFYACNWHPLTWLSHMTDCEVFGQASEGPHMVNVALHATNAVLLFLLLWRMTGTLARSGFVAVLFALHPLHVGSVAWVAERKDVLSTFFGLLSIWAYAAYASRRKYRWPRYVAALVLFGFSLMSKPMLVTLPFVFLLLDVLPLERALGEQKGIGWRIFAPLLIEKLPFFTLSGLSAVVTFYAQKNGGAVVEMATIPIEARVENAAVSYVRYLVKTFWPTGLSPHYPYPTVMPFWPGLAAGAVLLGVTAGVLWRTRRAPYLFTGWFWYLGTLLPVIGLVQVGLQAMADRYTYVPLIGIFIMVAWGAAELLAPLRYGRAVLVGIGAFIAAACFAGTWIQTQYWRDSIILFQRSLDVCPENNSLAEHNLAHALALVGDQRDAIPRFREAMRGHPEFFMCQYNWGNSVGLQGKLDEAIAHYQEAIRYSPGYEQAYYQLGNAFALQLKLDEARTNFLMAIRLKPDYVEAQTKLGNLLLLQGSNTEAMVHLRAAVTMQPDYDDGQYYLGAALARERKFAEAAACFRAAVAVSPQHASALNDLAWLLATQTDPQIRNPAEAVQLAERACKATRVPDPGYLDTLGVAYSEAGRFADAIKVTEQASAVATAAGNPALASEMRGRLDAYRAGKSYTQSKTH